jgi:hypothetical protein
LLLQRLIDQIAQQRAVARATLDIRLLQHHDRYQFLLRINPEVWAGRAAPVVVADRTRKHPAPRAPCQLSTQLSYFEVAWLEYARRTSLQFSSPTPLRNSSR